MNGSPGNSDTAVLVVSCDPYADLWPPCFELFFLHWPQCPYAVYLGSNTRVFDHPRVETLAVGADRGWADGVRAMLERIDARFVLLMLEDFLLEHAVEGSAVERARDKIRVGEVDCIRLGDANLFRSDAGAGTELRRENAGYCEPIPSEPLYGEIVPGTPYRVSTQISLWRKEALQQLLLPGATAWEFEEVGSLLAERLPLRFWMLQHPAFVYDHAIEKGKWKPAGLAICARHGITLDLSRRQRYSTAEVAAHLAEQAAQGSVARLRVQVIRQMNLECWHRALWSAVRLVHARPGDLGNWRVLCASLLGPRVFRAARARLARRKVQAIQRRVIQHA